MNISHLLLRMAGENRPAEAKVLELKAGQTVRAFVLGTTGDGEALLSVDGVQVKALLKGEVALVPGKLMSFLILPESTGGRLVLRPVETRTEGGAAALLRQFGLEDTAEHRAQLALMQREGVPVNRESFLSFKEALASRPPAVPAEAWTETALAAARRGLPPTKTVLQALHQALYGPPLDRLADALLAHASAWKQMASTAPPNEALLALVTRLEGRLQAIAQTMAEAAPDSPRSAAVPTADRGADPAAGRSASAPPPGGRAESAAVVRPSGGDMATAQAGRPDAGVPRGAVAPAAQASTGAPDAPEGTAAPTGAASRPLAPRPPAPPAGGPAVGSAQAQAPAGRESPGAAADAPVQAAARREAASGDGDRAAAAVSDARTAPAASAAPAVGRAAEPEPGGWLSRLLRLVGADLEHDWLTRAAMPLSRHPAPAGTAAGHPAPDLPMPADPAAAAESGEHAARESLKSILLQLRAHDELPAPFKETIQQTIQQITGQQLLLSTDRSGTFIQMTLFLPMLPGQDGQRPASVHIQSRKKGKQGALDADNCRLLFDLHLGFLGALLIDVQVVDRYVNVTLHHDDPRIKEWAAGERPSLEEALEKMGYRCAQLRCVPLPEPHPAEGAERGAGDPAAGGRRLPVRASQPYKGVDVRI